MKRAVIFVVPLVYAQLVVAGRASAGENMDYFDKPVARAEEIESFGVQAAAALAPQVPKVTAFISSGYSETSKVRGSIGGSYSFQTMHVDIEPGLALVGVDLVGEARAGTVGFDVTISPKLPFEHLQLGVDPELDVSDSGDLTYIGTFIAKTFWGDNKRGKLVVGATPSLVYNGSDYGYTATGSLGVGRDFGRNNASVTFKSKLSDLTFSGEQTVGGSVEFLFAIPLDRVRRLRFVIIPSATDLSAASDTLGIVGKALVTI